MLDQAFGRVTPNGSPVAPMPGYAFYPGVTDIANAQILDLQAGTDLQIDLRLNAKPRMYAIRGKVLDSRTGKSPPRAAVFASTPTPGVASLDLITGATLRDYKPAAGTFELRDLLPGTYTVVAIVQDVAGPGQREAAPQ